MEAGREDARARLRPAERHGRGSPLSDEAFRRYAHINLPHARTIVDRIGDHLDAFGAVEETGTGAAFDLHDAFRALEEAVRSFDEDPPVEAAVRAADKVAALARVVVTGIVAAPCRGDRLGQSVRNLFECLGLADEGRELSLRCGERPDSPLR